MFRKYVLPLLALAGVGLGILAALQSARTMVPTPMVSEAPSSPYRTFVAGAGLVEANTENIAIGTQIAGIVSKIDVQIGCQVKKGDPLFTIDDRATLATLASQQAAIKVAPIAIKQKIDAAPVKPVNLPREPHKPARVRIRQGAATDAVDVNSNKSMSPPVYGVDGCPVGHHAVRASGADGAWGGDPSGNPMRKCVEN